MRVRLLTSLTDLNQIWDEWITLYRTHGQVPFHNPELHRIWWQHLGIKEGWSPLVAIGRQNGRLVAVASLAVRRWRLLRVLEWAGIAAFDYPGVLMAPEADAGLLWDTIRRDGRFDVARLRWVRADATGCQLATETAFRTGPNQQTRAIDLVHPTPQSWLASLPKSMRAEYREKLRLMEKCGPVAMRFATQPDEIRAAVNALIRFKAAWSQSRGVETAYLVDGIEDYFQDLALAAARDHTLHLTTLEAGSDVLAAHLGFVSRDGLYYYVSSYDAAKAKWSPGRVHMTMLIMWSIEHGLRRFDFLRGDADYKNRLATSSRQLEDIVFPRGLIGRIVVQGFLQRQRRPGHQPAGAIRASALPIGLGGADA